MIYKLLKKIFTILPHAEASIKTWYVSFKSDLTFHTSLIHNRKRNLDLQDTG